MNQKEDGMDKNRSELFGQFSYDDSLTYEELLVLESSLMAEIEMLLLQAGAVHLDFTPLGDALMCQCAFDAHQLNVYRDIARKMAQCLPHGINGRLLCLDKNLSVQHFYWITRGQWQEEELPLPLTPPDGVKVNRVPLPPPTAEADPED